MWALKKIAQGVRGGRKKVLVVNSFLRVTELVIFFNTIKQLLKASSVFSNPIIHLDLSLQNFTPDIRQRLDKLSRHRRLSFIRAYKKKRVSLTLAHFFHVYSYTSFCFLYARRDPLSGFFFSNEVLPGTNGRYQEANWGKMFDAGGWVYERRRCGSLIFG